MWCTCCPSRLADTCSRLRLRLRSLRSLCRRWTGRRRCGAPARGRREACGRPRHQLTPSLTASALINKANAEVRRQKQEGHAGVVMMSLTASCRLDAAQTAALGQRLVAGALAQPAPAGLTNQSRVGAGLGQHISWNRKRVWECDAADSCQSCAGGEGLRPGREPRDALRCCCLIGCLKWATARITLRSFAQRRRPPWLVDGHLLSSTAYRRKNETHAWVKRSRSCVRYISGSQTSDEPHWDFKLIFYVHG